MIVWCLILECIRFNFLNKLSNIIIKKIILIYKNTLLSENSAQKKLIVWVSAIVFLFYRWGNKTDVDGASIILWMIMFEKVINPLSLGYVPESYKMGVGAWTLHLVGGSKTAHASFCNFFYDWTYLNENFTTICIFFEMLMWILEISVMKFWKEMKWRKTRTELGINYNTKSGRNYPMWSK